MAHGPKMTRKYFLDENKTNKDSRASHTHKNKKIFIPRKWSFWPSQTLLSLFLACQDLYPHLQQFGHPWCEQLLSKISNLWSPNFLKIRCVVRQMFFQCFMVCNLEKFGKHCLNLKKISVVEFNSSFKMGWRCT